MVLIALLDLEIIFNRDSAGQSQRLMKQKNRFNIPMLHFIGKAKRRRLQIVAESASNHQLFDDFIFKTDAQLKAVLRIISRFQHDARGWS